jgi:hypothetical protein
MKPYKNDLPIMTPEEGIVLFHPHIPQNAKKYVCDTLDSRWIGQGPKVDLFEERFKTQFQLTGPCVSVSSGTAALHLTYLLANIKKDDEVLVPLFTCTATNMPLLYIGAKLIFVDVDPKTMNVSVSDMRKKINERTKAIVVVHYGGLPCDMDEINELANEFGVPIIEDAAHALGAKYNGNYIGYNINNNEAEIEIDNIGQRLNYKGHRIFTENEIKGFRSITDTFEKQRKFIDVWTKKEAITKCLGLTLQQGMEGFEILENTKILLFITNKPYFFII